MLEVEWPQEPPRRVRHPDSVSAAMLSALQTFLEQCPLPTLEALREELAERAIDYHFLGYPRDPWMTSVTNLWLSIQDMHRQERLLRWEQETLPRLLQL